MNGQVGEQMEGMPDETMHLLKKLCQTTKC